MLEKRALLIIKIRSVRNGLEVKGNFLQASILPFFPASQQRIASFGPINDQAPGCHLIPTESPEVRRHWFLHQEPEFTVAHGYSLHKLLLVATAKKWSGSLVQLCFLYL